MKTSFLCHNIEKVPGGLNLTIIPSEMPAAICGTKGPPSYYIVTIQTPERDDTRMRGLFFSLIHLIALSEYGESGTEAEESVYQGIIEQYGPPLKPYHGVTRRKSWSLCDTKERCQLIEGAIAELSAAGMVYEDSGSIVSLIAEWHDWRYRQKTDPLVRKTAEAYRSAVPYCEACIRKPGAHLAHIVSRGRGAGAFDDWNILHLCQACHIETQHAIGWDRFLQRFPHLRGKVNKAHERAKGGGNE